MNKNSSYEQPLSKFSFLQYLALQDVLSYCNCETSIIFFIIYFLFYAQKCIAVIKFVPNCVTPKSLKGNKMELKMLRGEEYVTW